MLKDPYLVVEETAKKSDNKNIKAGAIIVSSEGMTIGTGHSSLPKFGIIPIEIIAVQCACPRKKIKMSNVYIYIEDSKGNPISAKPSTGSKNILYAFGVAKIYYRDERKKWQKINLLQRNG